MKNSRRRSSASGGLFSRLSAMRPNTAWIRGGLVVLLVVGLGGVAYDFVSFATSSPFFETRFRVRGLEQVPVRKVKRSLRELTSPSGSRPSLFRVSASRVRRHLKQTIPRFKTVRVVKEYPSDLVVTVSERTPRGLVARVRGDGERFYLLAGTEGVMFPPEPGERERLRQTLPVIFGLEKLKPQSAGYSKRWNRALKVLSAVRNHFTVDSVNWIEVLPGGYVEMEINRPRNLEIRLGVGGYGKKMRRVAELMTTPQFQDVQDYINVSDLDQILVR